MAGPAPQSFNETKVRAGLRYPMQMGMPVDVALRPTFYFRQATIDGTTDPTGAALDLNAGTPDTPETGVQVLCAVEQREGESDETVLGTFDADEYIVTVLDEEWEEISDFTYCTLGGRYFDRSKEMYHYGLFTVTVYQMRVEARDA